MLYDIARLHLMVPIDFWHDSTPFGCPPRMVTHLPRMITHLLRRYLRTTAGNQDLSQLQVIFILLVGDHPRDGNCPRDGDCPNNSDHSIDGGYPCLLESSVSICHIIQYCEISPKKVGDHPCKMGDQSGWVGHPNVVESCQKSIGTIRCNLAISYNN